MKNQMKQDEYERTFNLSGNEPQNKVVELDHILFQVEQFRLKIVGDSASKQLVREMLKDLKQYLIEQNNG